MGPLKASELLLFGKKVSASEAEALGLITKCFPAGEFHSSVWPKLKEMSELPPTVSLKLKLLHVFLPVCTWYHLILNAVAEVWKTTLPWHRERASSQGQSRRNDEIEGNVHI